MRKISAIAIVIAAATMGSVAGIAGMHSASHATITVAGTQCPDTMVWDGTTCV